MIRRLVFNREIQDSDKHLDEHILFTFMGQCQAKKNVNGFFSKIHLLKTFSSGLNLSNSEFLSRFDQNSGLINQMKIQF